MQFPKILFSLVPDSNHARLERTLPPGYTIEALPFEEGKPDIFVVFVGSAQVASVVAGDNGFDFLFEDRRESWRLKDELEKLYFSNTIKWLLVFPSHEKKWGYVGTPVDTKDLALANVSPVVMKRGALLVGFRASEWASMQNSLSYLHSFQVRGTVESPTLDETDMGGAMIEFTTLERG